MLQSKTHLYSGTLTFIRTFLHKSMVVMMMKVIMKRRMKIDIEQDMPWERCT